MAVSTTSNINPAWPDQTAPTVLSVQTNLGHAKAEIEALNAAVNALGAQGALRARMAFRSRSADL